jgi:AraC family transcriptional activator FtrA
MRDIDTSGTFSVQHAGQNVFRLNASICSGVFLLAFANLLDGRKAAVHWAQASILAKRFPRVKVDNAALYVDEDDILTSAGRAAGMDLCLHIIRKDFGGRIAHAVAQRMVIPAYRDGGQAQYIPHSAQTQINELAELRAWVSNNICRKLTLDDMAAYARMSRWTFIRRFEAAIGLSPGEWLVRERVERARSLLEDTSMPVEHVAAQVGFASYEALRHHFQKRFQTSPVRYRSSFRSVNPQ